MEDKRQEVEDKFIERVNKAIRLKDYAISQGYEVDKVLISILNEHIGPKNVDINHEKRCEFDQALSELTRLTYPVTADTLSSETQSKSYERFKLVLFVTGFVTLFLAIIGFYLSVAPSANLPAKLPDQMGNVILALALGLMGAVVYSLFNVLRIIPPQAFDFSDEYANYARLLLGLLLGWIFYFTFAMDKFLALKNVAGLADKRDAFYLLIPFLAGYSTKFVISLLERTILALETALGVEEQRSRSMRKTKLFNRENPKRIT